MNCSNFTVAENPDSIYFRKNYVISGSYQSGYIIPNSPYLLHDINDPEKFKRYNSVSLQFLKQTMGEKIWEQVYDYPLYGIGVNVANFSDNPEFSHPVALYGIVKAPIFRWSRMSLNAETGFGISLNPKIFDPTINNYNPGYASHITSFIDLGLNVGFELNRHFCLKVGYDFVHNSNGRMKTPNGGINMYSPKLALEYNVNGYKRPEIKKQVPPYVKNTSIDFSAYGGYKNLVCLLPGVDTLTKYTGVFYKVYGVSAILNRQVSYKSKIGLGFTVGYDGNNNTSITVQNGTFVVNEGPLSGRINLSVFASYELVLNRFSLLMQPGIYIVNKPNDNISHLFYEIRPVTYQRLGVKYHINENYFVGVNVHGYVFHHADFLEWNFGYKLGLPKKHK